MSRFSVRLVKVVGRPSPGAVPCRATPVNDMPPCHTATGRPSYGRERDFVCLRSPGGARGGLNGRGGAGLRRVQSWSAPPEACGRQSPDRGMSGTRSIIPPGRVPTKLTCVVRSGRQRTRAGSFNLARSCDPWPGRRSDTDFFLFFFNPALLASAMQILHHDHHIRPPSCTNA